MLTLPQHLDGGSGVGQLIIKDSEDPCKTHRVQELNLPAIMVHDVEVMEAPEGRGGRASGEVEKKQTKALIIPAYCGMTISFKVVA